MLQLFGCMFITIWVILIIVLQLEYKIKENEKTILLSNENKKNKTKKNDIYNNVLIDYINNTQDTSILIDDPVNNLQYDSSFIDPNLSIKYARSNFTVKPLNFNLYENTKNLTNICEKNILKKIK